MRTVLEQRHHLPGGRTAPAARSGGAFAGLADFLTDYYAAMTGLREERDFYELAAAYLATARRQGVVYTEMFFDPQAHTTRGVPFETVVTGIHRAQVDARAAGGPDSQLIMCFLRDASVDSALDILAASMPYRRWIVGVGLDSDERGNPPARFAEVFSRARSVGYRVTMHCDPRQEDTLAHLWQCLDVIRVERIDHGVGCLDDPGLCDEIRRRRIGLTVCPLSNLRLYGDLMEEAVGAMLELGLLVTINSDDPAYFGGYVGDNLRAVQEAAGLDRTQVMRLTRNAFEVAWLAPAQRDRYLLAVDAYASEHA